jgi:hypothetical protein
MKNRMTPDLYTDLVGLEKSLEKLANSMANEVAINENFAQYMTARYTVKVIRNCRKILKGEVE